MTIKWRLFKKKSKYIERKKGPFTFFWLKEWKTEEEDEKVIFRDSETTNENDCQAKGDSLSKKGKSNPLIYINQISQLN